MGLTTPTLFVSATPSVTKSGISAIAQVNFDPPPNGSPDGNQQVSGGGSSRPTCPQDAHLVSFSPAINWGETIDNNPTFLLYFSTTPAAVAFTLKDERTSEAIYQSLISIEARSGIFKFRLPDDAPDLEVDRPYRWIFQVSCHSSASPQNEGLAVNGIIVRRSNSELQTQIENASPREKVEFYAEHGFWFDTLNELLKQ